MQSSSPLYSTCEEDENGNLVFEIPEELLQVMDWKEGTTLDIEVLPGTIVLREVKEEGVGDS
jgi:antitoxin component of MazEF toxin-antitoxin module